MNRRGLRSRRAIHIVAVIITIGYASNLTAQLAQSSEASQCGGWLTTSMFRFRFSPYHRRATIPGTSLLLVLWVFVSLTIAVMHEEDSSQWHHRVRVSVGYPPHARNDTDIYVVDTNDDNPVLLTVDTTFDGHSAWSPYGSRIAFFGFRITGADVTLFGGGGPSWKSNIYVIEAGGNGLVRLDTDISSLGGRTPSLDWSPVPHQCVRAANETVKTSSCPKRILNCRCRPHLAIRVLRHKFASNARTVVQAAW